MVPGAGGAGGWRRCRLVGISRRLLLVGLVLLLFGLLGRLGLLRHFPVALCDAFLHAGFVVRVGTRSGLGLGEVDATAGGPFVVVTVGSLGQSTGLEGSELVVQPLGRFADERADVGARGREGREAGGIVIGRVDGGCEDLTGLGEVALLEFVVTQGFGDQCVIAPRRAGAGLPLVSGPELFERAGDITAQHEQVALGELFPEPASEVSHVDPLQRALHRGVIAGRELARQFVAEDADAGDFDCEHEKQDQHRYRPQQELAPQSQAARPVDCGLVLWRPVSLAGFGGREHLRHFRTVPFLRRSQCPARPYNSTPSNTAATAAKTQ
ncbi:hypothetical protein ATO49_01580 [Mycolicibacterium fortuitum subsp. fortuitum DSM 46621 = ATCC 6841 = JCM 6387]|nr:hypothetical protein ATO49_01580 [Mycolicibacterium fortuitum subsp. fortuitum DSM 46621 = ATCC 6841 = JCM 6387]